MSSTEGASRKGDTSHALTEIRTVRSRAISALEVLTNNGGRSEIVHVPAGMDDDGYFAARTERHADPDADKMIALLTDFIAKTQRFARGERRPSNRPGRF